MDENDNILDMNTEWDYYSGLPNPKAYEEQERSRGGGASLSHATKAPRAFSPYLPTSLP